MTRYDGDDDDDDFDDEQIFLNQPDFYLLLPSSVQSQTECYRSSLWRFLVVYLV